MRSSGPRRSSTTRRPPLRPRRRRRHSPQRRSVGQTAIGLKEAPRGRLLHVRGGAAASTFERVAREAGVSRGLLHYYFQTKEKLLVEVVRRDTELRLAAL